MPRSDYSKAHSGVASEAVAKEATPDKVLKENWAPFLLLQMYTMSSKSVQQIDRRFIHSADLSVTNLLAVSVHLLFYLILKTTCEKGCHYTCFAEEETEAQRAAQVAEPMGGRAGV